MLLLELKLNASEFVLVMEEEAWGRVEGRQMRGFRTYWQITMKRRIKKFKNIMTNSVDRKSPSL